MEMPATRRTALRPSGEMLESDAFIYFQSSSAVYEAGTWSPFQVFVKSDNHCPETKLNFGYSSRVSVTQRIALRSNASGNGDQFAVLAPLARTRKSM